MLTNRDTAQYVSTLMVSLGSQLNESVRIVGDTESESVANEYRRAVAHILGEMLLGVMNPLYEAHPDLKPEGLD